jgi:hypothetical protein
VLALRLLLRLRRRSAACATFVVDVVTVLATFVVVKVAVSIASKVLALRLRRRSAACRATFGTEFELLLLKELVLGGWRTCCCIMRGDADLFFEVCAGSGRCCTCCCSLPRSGSQRLISNKETHVNRWSGSRYAW